jgi:hypothetical protein
MSYPKSRSKFLQKEVLRDVEIEVDKRNPENPFFFRLVSRRQAPTSTFIQTN